KAAVLRVDGVAVGPIRMIVWVDVAIKSWAIIQVLTGKLVALPHENTGEAAAVRLEGILHADVGARARLDPVVTGELRELEQVRVVEDEAFRILVGQAALSARFLVGDDLADRLDGVRRA